MLIRDTSGSVSDAELERYTSEVVGIATGMGIRGRDLRIMDVDAAVQHTADYTGAAGLAQVHGRGGTDMRVGIQAALDLKPRPHAIVVFTDGETPWPDTKPRCAAGGLPGRARPRRRRPSGCRSGRSRSWSTTTAEGAPART